MYKGRGGTSVGTFSSHCTSTGPDDPCRKSMPNSSWKVVVLGGNHTGEDPPGTSWTAGSGWRGVWSEVDASLGDMTDSRSASAVLLRDCNSRRGSLGTLARRGDGLCDLLPAPRASVGIAEIYEIDAAGPCVVVRSVRLDCTGSRKGLTSATEYQHALLQKRRRTLPGKHIPGCRHKFCAAAQEVCRKPDIYINIQRPRLLEYELAKRASKSNPTLDSKLQPATRNTTKRPAEFRTILT
ncbi:hypothetical protein BKA93DRAFT_748766 [Sparassis latifolia]